MPQPDWEELERRIARLEKLMGVGESPVPSGASPAPVEILARPSVNTSAILPILGRALLGLAGAYLLRALTETATIPPAAGVAAGILYAICWLFWAARTPAGDRMEAATHSLTAVLVLCPLLWEATLRFHAISTWTAAALLIVFALVGLAVSWRKNLLTVATIVTLAGLGTAAGLLVATHDVVPFTLVFLAIAAAVETSSCLEHWLSERWLTALTADLAVLLATWLVTRQDGLPEGYAAIPHGWLLGMQVALLAIYLFVCGLTVWGIAHYRSIAAQQRDIAKRLIREEEYRKLVVDELQHRLKNKLSSIHAVLRQVLQDQPQIWAGIDLRLRALSATDDLIARIDGSGCDIKDLLLSELGPYGHVRFTLNGDPLFLPAKLAVSLALVFHELATNAGKYGAFSAARGLLQVSWSVSDGRLTIRWDETEGPAIETVGKAGFGTKLLKSALRPFDGGTEIAFLKTGVHCTLQCRIPQS